jgi:hypothetical protein
VSGGAELATQTANAKGARPASQGPQLDAQALAQLAGGVRLVSADAEAQLARFSDPVLMHGGKINLISLEAIQKALADKWPPRKTQVFAFAERVLHRHLAGQGVYLRVSDTDYFVIHPQMSRFAGQAACLRYLREILSHFLGDDAEAVSGVLQVTRVGKGRLEAAQVDPVYAEQALGRGETGEPDLNEQLAAFDLEATPKAAALSRWAPFLATDGRKLRVSARLEPIYELKSFTRIGFRMVRRVLVLPTGEELSHREIAALSSSDILRADLATILRGIDRLRTDAQEQQPSLVVPLSFSSLSSQRGRTELTTPLQEAGSLVKLGVICEILDLDGVPAGALVSAATLVRPFSLLVVGNLETPSPKSFARLAGAHLQALSFECPQHLGEAEFMGWANTTVPAARKVARSVIVYRAPSPQHAGVLASAGATHVSLARGAQ